MRRGEERRDQFPALPHEDALKVEVTAAVTRAHIAEGEAKAKAHHAFFCDPPSSNVLLQTARLSGRKEREDKYANIHLFIRDGRPSSQSWLLDGYSQLPDIQIVGI